MSALYHLECRFASEGQKYLSFFRLWWDMKKEGCSCCWEIETMLYITTSGGLSTLQLTTPSTTISVSVCVSLTLSFSLSALLWLCSGSFSPFCCTFTFLIMLPLCIHTVDLLCVCVCVCACTSLQLIEFATFSPPLPTMSVLAPRLYLSGAKRTF